jgi:hypothetical protein
VVVVAPGVVVVAPGVVVVAPGVVVVAPGVVVVAPGVVVVAPGAVVAGGVAESVGSPPPAGVVVVPAGSLVPPPPPLSQAPRTVARPKMRAIPSTLIFITPLSPITTRTIFCLLNTIAYLLLFVKPLQITYFYSFFFRKFIFLNQVERREKTAMKVTKSKITQKLLAFYLLPSAFYLLASAFRQVFGNLIASA